jgi:hypothetical protein
MSHTDADGEYTGIFNGALGHTDLYPFCDDMACPDKEDQETIGIVGGYVGDGLMTTNEADHYYRGKTI